jgi:hypothetical protein
LAGYKETVTGSLAMGCAGTTATGAAVFCATGALVSSVGVELQAARTLVTANARRAFFMIILVKKMG